MINLSLRIFTLAAVCSLAIIATVAQNNDAALIATGKNVKITAADLNPEARIPFDLVAKGVADVRSNQFSAYLADVLLETEANAKGVSVAQLEADAAKSVPMPDTKTIQSVYDANKEALGNKPLDEVREVIVSFLRREPEQQAVQEMIDGLQKKYELKLEKSVNATDIKPSDVIARISAKPITYQQFTEAKKIQIADGIEHVYDHLKMLIDDEVLASLIKLEAKERNLDESALIAAEITNRMREFSDQERIDLTDSFARRLFAKYQIKYEYQMPTPFVYPVTADDDPFTGAANAPVTIIMFSDFQCPACAGTHPELKRVMAEYPGKVKLVVRDFPLESIHADAFGAAVAANAAHAQGKFLEYVEILYASQDALDAASLRKYAERVGLELKRFDADTAKPEFAAEIRKDIADGAKLGVGGTPTIFVNGLKVHRLSAPAFRDAIESALKKQ